MRYDIITITYNSSRWLDDYFAALEALQYDKSLLRLILVDNGSRDDTLQKVCSYKERTSLGEVKLVQSPVNLGFGAGNNLGVRHGDAPFLFLLNTDTQLFPNSLDQLDAVINASAEDAVCFEMRQVPMESEKHYDPVTLETDWAAGAAVAIKRGAFEAIGGFDEGIFMYAEDVDLSWRLRANGGRLLYCPKAAVVHHGWKKSEAGLSFEYRHTLYAKLLLAYKYGDLSTIWQQNLEYLRSVRHPSPFPHIRKELAKLYLKHFTRIPYFLSFRRKQPALFAAADCDFQRGYTPARGMELSAEPTIQPLVSVIVRTHKRPSVLARTLESLRGQVYRNFEVVVIEDGENTAEEMLRSEFSDLNISYYATGEHLGRCKTGNLGMQRAKGELLCFLDDDDYFYGDCLSSFVRKFEDAPQAEMMISAGMVYHSQVQSTDPYLFTMQNIHLFRYSHITLLDMCAHNCIPICCCMFRKELFERHGGIREDIDGDEDWALWLKFMRDAKRMNPYNTDVNRALCLFGQPANEDVAQERLDAYAAYEQAVVDDLALSYTVPGEEIRTWESYIKADIAHLRNLGKLDTFLARLRSSEGKQLCYDAAGANTVTAKQLRDHYDWLVRHCAKQA